MSRAIPSYMFVLVVVQHGNRFLVIHEAKHGQGWYLPAGRVESGETILETAVRETAEEAGVRINPTGLLWFEQEWVPNNGHNSACCRWRFVLLAQPVSDDPVDLAPKSVADKHSLEARWLTPYQIGQLPLRSSEVQRMIARANDPMALKVPLSVFVTPNRYDD